MSSTPEGYEMSRTKVVRQAWSRKDMSRTSNPTTPQAGHERKAPSSEVEEQLEMYRFIFDAIHNGVMVTDPEGYVTHMNAPYGEFLQLNPAEQIGKHCTEVVENTRMHIVAQTGKPEINRSQHIRGQSMVVQRIPIRKKGRIIAVYGQVMFKDVKDVGRLANRLSLLESKVRLYEQELMNLRSARYTFESIIGCSRAIESLKREAIKATGNDSPVLITGESGTGKEIFAQAIHQASLRKVYPFIRINCAAIPRDLMESELFGYAKGAFTGALSDGKPGKFELADQGTVFLDEIGDLSLDMQPKLLRVIEDKELERLGGTKLIRSDFRIIAATNQDISQMVAEGRFRTDLFYRLNVIPLHIPPLRERREDILPLVRHFIDLMAREAAFSEIGLDAEAAEILQHYDWPGNVRELTNVLERTLASLDGDVIRASDLPFHLRQDSCRKPAGAKATLHGALDAAEKEIIAQALSRTGNNKSRAAAELGIHRTLLYKKMRKHGLCLDGSG
jgi:transcriptional regulator with PAS, ATPase and Fis domain